MIHFLEFRWIVTFALWTSIFVACSKVPETTVAPESAPTHQQSRSFDQHAREARGAYFKEPRDI